MSDIAMPNEFLRWIMSLINHLKSDNQYISEKVFDKEKHLIIALSQKVFREVNEKEKQRFIDLFNYTF